MRSWKKMVPQPDVWTCKGCGVTFAYGFLAWKKGRTTGLWCSGCRKGHRDPA